MWLILSGIVAFGLAYGQSASSTLAFDVAVVKRATPNLAGGRMVVGMLSPDGGVGTQRPGRIRYAVISLKYLIINAYDLKPFQIAGPAWLDSEFFDVEATFPPDTTKEQFRTMLQNLLSDRFKLTIHRETKEGPVYSLVVSKTGPKMKESTDAPVPEDSSDSKASSQQRQQPQIGPDGFPIQSNVPGGRPSIFSVVGTRGIRLNGQKQTMHELADRLTTILRSPVSNHTALAPKYDFTLTFAPEELAARSSGADALPDIFTAVQLQLGLKLEAKKGPVDTIVIDHVEKIPTGN